MNYTVEANSAEELAAKTALAIRERIGELDRVASRLEEIARTTEGDETSPEVANGQWLSRADASRQFGVPVSQILGAEKRRDVHVRRKGRNVFVKADDVQHLAA